jgi:hypothetical protein
MAAIWYLIIGFRRVNRKSQTRCVWRICRQILGCGHPSRSSTAGITSWWTADLGNRVSVTQIRTGLHLLLMSFPSSDMTSNGIDHGQRSGCIAIGRNCWLFRSIWVTPISSEICVVHVFLLLMWFIFLCVLVVCSRDVHVIGFMTFDWPFYFSHTYLEEPSLLVIKGLSTWPLWSRAASLFLTLYTGGLYECLLEA